MILRMDTPPKRKRSTLRSILLGSFVVVFAMVVIVAMWINNFIRRRVPLSQVKFPVLVLQPNELLPFAEWDSPQLILFENSSARTPVDGTTIIDADFNIYMQENVKRKESDLGWLARRYLTPGLRVRYSFDLKRVSRPDQEAAMKLILGRERLSDDATENAALHAAVAKQTTVAGVLDALKLYKQIDPVPTTEPAVIESTDPGPTTIEPLP